MPEKIERNPDAPEPAAKGGVQVEYSFD